jgi:hypothetical protein
MYCSVSGRQTWYMEKRHKKYEMGIMCKAKWYKRAVSFKHTAVPLSWYISRTVTLPVPVCHLPKSCVICVFCNLKYNSDEVSPVICMAVAHDLSWSVMISLIHDKRTEWYSWALLYQDYIQKTPDIMHACRHRKSHKGYDPPNSVTWRQLLRQQTNTDTSTTPTTETRALSLRVTSAWFRERYLRLKLGTLKN